MNGPENGVVTSDRDTSESETHLKTDRDEKKELLPKKSRKTSRSSQHQQRRSRRNTTTPLLQELARHIVSSTPVVFITGAGLSAASGIRTFRGPDGLWSEVVWKKATREAFRKDPLGWYNDFWLIHFPPHTYGEFYEANEAHEAISILASLPNSNVKVITQNIDGLHYRTQQKWNHGENLIEAHGRLGFYKCISDSNSEKDSDEDTVDSSKQQKSVLGSTRVENMSRCKYEFDESIPASEIEPRDVRLIISGVYTQDINVGHSVESDHELAMKLQKSLNKTGRGLARQSKSDPQNNPTFINEPPLCPSCRRPVLPQALQFDESYHSHGHYQFELIEDWIDNSSIIVFVGTSFSVTLTQYALENARKENKRMFNFNIDVDALENASWMNVENIIGDVQRTLPELVKLCKEEHAG